MRTRPLAPLAVVKALVLVLILLKLLMLVMANVFQDEAYYWMWGQHPALSYFDHPPLNAWLQGLAGAVFGWNKFSMRLPVALAWLADIWLLWLISKRIAPDWPEHFWLTMVMFLVTPIFFAVTGWALPDYLLFTAILAALYFFLAFLERWPEAPRWRDLYFGAACLGLAGLAKYNAAFLGLGLGLHIVLSPRLRPLLLKPQLYVAAGIAVLLQVPVVIWNLQENLASYGFIFGSRHAALRAGLAGVTNWLIWFFATVGPFLVVPLLAFAFRPLKGAGLSRTTFWLSSVVIIGLSYFTTTLFHWNLVAYAVALPFLAFHLRWRWLTWLHIAYGTAFLVAILVHYSWVPLGDVKSMDDEATGWAYGWDEIAQAVSAAAQGHQADFIATPDYTTAALLGFALRDKDVTSLNPHRDQYDYWFDPAAHAGQDAIIYADIWRPLRDAVKVQFTEIIPLAEVPVVRGQQEVNRGQIYLGKGYIPSTD